MKPTGPLFAIAAGYLLLTVSAAVLAPWLAPYSPIASDLFSVNQLPTADHLLGTDVLGRDVLSRVLFGAQGALLGVAQAAAIFVMLGVPAGVIAGYLGGVTDQVVTRIIDFMLAVPTIIVVLSVLTVFGGDMTAAMIAYGVIASAGLARIVRSAVLAVRQELHIKAAIVGGLTSLQIVARHVLPRAVGIVIVHSALFAAVALGIQTGLAFLGFGAPPPAPSWGGMVAEAASLLYRHPWLLVPSGGVIALTALAFGLLGDALRDANADRFAARARPRRSRSASGRTFAAIAPSQPIQPGSLLSVRDLTVMIHGPHGETPALEGIDFDIQPGEIVGLVGESGSGKSLTALAILGLLPEVARVTRGSIVLEGRDIAGFTKKAYREVRGREIAMISQEPMVALDPAFRVGSQIAEVVRTHDRCGRKAAQRRVLELLRLVRLPDPARVARMYPHQLSGGMAQRVVIAAALAGRPKLLIADEPTTALDVTVQAEILDLLRTLQSQTGMSVLFVTHDWGVVADICSRAVVMYAGQVVETAPVQEIFREPLHPYTQALLRSNPYFAKKGAPLPSIGGSVPAPGNWPVGCHFAARCHLALERCSMGPIEVEQLHGGRSSRCVRANELEEGLVRDASQHNERN